LEAQNHAAEIKIRAQRRAGEILKESEKAKGTRGQLIGKDSSGGYAVKPPETETPTFKDLGVEKRDAHQWQYIAELPDDQFEEKISDSPRFTIRYVCYFKKYRGEEM